MDQEARIFRALGEPTRLRLAAVLAKNGEVCVCVLAAALELPDFKISHHLSILKNVGVVAARREGTWMHYRLAAPDGPLPRALQRCLRDCLAANPVLKLDLQRLNRACCRPGDPGVKKAKKTPTGKRPRKETQHG
ncbi:MAG: ArsR/SmtB family transcription factor [Planctomycetota bacterium]